MENSSFDLTRSIVDEGRFKIDSYYNNTGDRSFYNNHYYSNKAPGISFLSVPVYAAWKFIYQSFPESFRSINSGSDTYSIQLVNDVPIIWYLDPGFFIRVSMILVTIFTSSLFSALTIVLIYKISGYFTKNEKNKIFITISYGLGTLAFAYARTFTTHAAGTFFALLAFYLLFKMKQDKIKDKKFFILAGLSLGFSLVIDYWIFLIAFVLFIYAIFSFRNKNILFFILSGLIGILPLLLYNYSIFNNPLEFTFKYQDPSIWTWPSWLSTSKNLGFSLGFPKITILLQLLIYPYRGLLFYCPILIASFIGLIFMYKFYKIESVLIAGIFIIFLYANSTYFYWWSGYSFGPRFLLPVIPFLTLPIAYSFEKNWKIITFLLIISIFINFLSLQNWEEVIVDIPGGGMNKFYEEKLNSFQILANPITEHYIPLFINNGPTSGILETILDPNRNLDIRNTFFTKYGETHLTEIPIFFLKSAEFASLKIRYLSLFLLSIIFLLIWKKEILNIFKNSIVIVLLIIMLFGICFISVNNLIYLKNWHQEEYVNNKNYRWVSQDALIKLYAPENGGLLSFKVGSFYEPRTLEIYINDKIIMSEKITYEKEINIPLLELNKTEYIIKFHSLEGCKTPIEAKMWNDIRCLSFDISNIKFIPMKDLYHKIVYMKNWFVEEKSNSYHWRWMSQNATLNIYSPDPFCSKIDMNIKSYYKPRTLHMFVNNISIREYAVSTQKTNIAPIICLNQSENVIEFQSKEGCNIPEILENSTDSRCLSFEILSLEISFAG